MMGLIVETSTKPKPKAATKDDGALLAEAAIDALMDDLTQSPPGTRAL